jgi:DNA modification methylase
MLYIKTETVQQVITSPPYFGVMRYGNVHDEIGTKGTLEQYIKDLTEVFQQCFRVLKPTGTFMLNIDNAKRENGFLSFSAWDIIPILRQAGFHLLGTIIWMDRGRKQLPHGFLDHHYEPIFVLAKTSHYVLNKYQAPEGDIWEILNPRKEDEEADRGDVWDRSGGVWATFPVELITYLVALGSNEGDTVLDPFAGSGTVMDVCQRLNRSSIAIEVNSTFCDRILERCFTRPNGDNLYQTLGELERNSKTTKPLC